MIAPSSKKGEQLAEVNGTTDLILAEKPAKKKRKAVVLDEDLYVDSLEHIIQRDFFPALTPMQTILDPELRTSRRPSTRGGFEDDDGTPRCARGDSPDISEAASGGDKGQMLPPKPKRRIKKQDLTLDKFVNTYTSEDNESYEYLSHCLPQQNFHIVLLSVLSALINFLKRPTRRYAKKHFGFVLRSFQRAAETVILCVSLHYRWKKAHDKQRPINCLSFSLPRTRLGHKNKQVLSYYPRVVSFPTYLLVSVLAEMLDSWGYKTKNELMFFPKA